MNRKTITGRPNDGWIPAQRVSLETALAAFSREAAYACYDDDSRGTLTPGKLADIVVLSADPFALPAEEIHTVYPLLTMVGGKVVYRVPATSSEQHRP